MFQPHPLIVVPALESRTICGALLEEPFWETDRPHWNASRFIEWKSMLLTCLHGEAEAWKLNDLPKVIYGRQATERVLGSLRPRISCPPPIVPAFPAALGWGRIGPSLPCSQVKPVL